MPQIPADFTVLDERELAALDALLAGHDAPWWNHFYQDRGKPIPFFSEHPDESLVQALPTLRIAPGRALDLGCGNARNAIHLARCGFAVEGWDHSQAAIDWAAQRCALAQVTVRLHCRSVFELAAEARVQDLVYDSGCFHHIAPHRRHQYVNQIAGALAPGGWFGLVCFRPEGGSGLTDDEVYRHRSLGGGLGCTEERLREIWTPAFVVRSLRAMQKHDGASGLFGQPYLWSLWAQRR